MGPACAPSSPAIVETGGDMAPCKDIAGIKEVKQPETRQCSECVKIASRWLHLRTCQTCGVTLCCDSSPHRHMSKHARTSEHPVIASAQPGERWLYCYQHDAYVEY